LLKGEDAKAMKIQVELLSSLAEYSPTGGNRFLVSLDEAIPVKELLELLKIPERSGEICLINGHHPSEGRRLQEGDVITIFPMVDGG
jgi:molybdopterin converting factor small subunit